MDYTNGVFNADNGLPPSKRTELIINTQTFDGVVDLTDYTNLEYLKSGMDIARVRFPKADKLKKLILVQLVKLPEIDENSINLDDAARAYLNDSVYKTNADYQFINSGLAKLKSIEELTVAFFDRELIDATMRLCRHLPKLRTLNLYGFRLNNSKWEISDLPQLETLNIQELSGKSQLFIWDMPKLKTLTIHGHGGHALGDVTILDYEGYLNQLFVKNLPSLETFCLNAFNYVKRNKEDHYFIDLTASTNLESVTCDSNCLDIKLPKAKSKDDTSQGKSNQDMGGMFFSRK